jgi:hypothetical protein
MKAGPKPGFLKNQVAYYLLAPGNSGANGEWKYGDNFETLTANPKPFYLDSKNGDADGVFRSGSLNEKQPNKGMDTFVYDPWIHVAAKTWRARSERKNGGNRPDVRIEYRQGRVGYHTDRYRTKGR